MYRWLVNTVAITLTVVGLVACEEKSKTTFQHYTGPVEEVEDVLVRYSEKGFVTVELKTPKQLRYANENKVFPDTVKITFLDVTGRTVSSVRADSGNYDYSKNIYTVLGNVQVVNLDNQEYLYTNELKWNPVTKVVYNEVHNKIIKKSANETLNGIGLDAKQDFSAMSLRKVNGITNFKL